MLTPEQINQFRTGAGLTPLSQLEGGSSQNSVGRFDYLKQQQEEKPGFLSRVGSTIGKELSSIPQAFERGADIVAEGDVIGGGARAALGTGGAITRAVFSPVTEALAPLVESAVKASGVTDNEMVQGAFQKLDTWAKANPDAAANLKDVFDIGTTFIGAGATKPVAGAITTAAKTMAKGVAETAAKVAGKAGELVQPVTELAAPVLESAARIPSRIATNVEASKAVEETIKKLPTKLAQTAARDGVDPRDLGTLYKIPTETKPAVQELMTAVKEVAAGGDAEAALKAVGTPIVKRIKEMTAQKSIIGKQLGEVANTLPAVTSDELTPVIFENLKRVPGLSGLAMDEKGLLNFTDTVLATELSRADQNAIQNIFVQATKAGTGKQKHLLRQELFEVLGGKKKSLTGITDTQDKAFQAVRTGLSEVLESKNGAYKSLSNEYRKLAQPLTDLRAYMRTIPGATEDVLQMQAGLLARRLTGNAPSNPIVKDILKRMDQATKKAGTAQISTETLQDVYNVLNRYFDIAAQTSLQGQVAAGIEGGGGVLGALAKAGRAAAGETPAVRQRALEGVMDEILGVTRKGGTPRPKVQTPANKGAISAILSAVKRGEIESKLVQKITLATKDSPEIKEIFSIPKGELHKFRAIDETAKGGKIGLAGKEINGANWHITAIDDTSSVNTRLQDFFDRGFIYKGKADESILPVKSFGSEYTPASRKVSDAFLKSDNQKTIGSIKGKKIVIGDFGNNHDLRKVSEGKSDRFPKEELKKTIAMPSQGVFRASDDVTNYRSDNAAWVFRGKDEYRVVYTRENPYGDEEIIGWHTTKNPKYIDDLRSFGVPDRIRTDEKGLEGL